MALALAFVMVAGLALSYFEPIGRVFDFWFGATMILLAVVGFMTSKRGTGLRCFVWFFLLVSIAVIIRAMEPIVIVN